MVHEAILNPPISWYGGNLFHEPREDQFKNLGVHVEVNREVTSKMLKELTFDAVIVATGAKPLIPDVPGIYRENVVTAVDVLTGKCGVGDRVVVIDCGHGTIVAKIRTAGQFDVEPFTWLAFKSHQQALIITGCEMTV
jgi:alkyl hydroperoxide reductase subunit AhpF